MKHLSIISLILFFSFIFLLFGCEGETLVGQAKASALTSIYVRNTQSPSCGVGSPYTTIQSAVTAAPVRSTITLCPGQYAESVTINKQLTIQGFENPISNPSQASIIIAPGNDQNLFTVTAARVMLRRLEFRDSYDANPTPTAAVLISRAGNVEVSNSVFSGNTYGIYVDTSRSALIYANQFISNEVAIMLKRGVSAQIYENAINGSNRDCINSYGIERDCVGIILTESSNLNTIRDNQIDNINEGTGIQLHSSSTNTISSNRVTNLPYGWGFWINGGRDNVIRDNSAFSSSGPAFPAMSSGFVLQDVRDTQVINNNAQNTSEGFRISSVRTVTLTDNIAVENGIGFSIEGIPYPPAASSLGMVSLQSNRAFSNSRFGLEIRSINPILINDMTFEDSGDASIYIWQPQLQSEPRDLLPFSITITDSAFASSLLGEPGSSSSRYSHISANIPAGAPSNTLTITNSVFSNDRSQTITPSTARITLSDAPAQHDFALKRAETAITPLPEGYTSFHNIRLSIEQLETTLSTDINMETLILHWDASDETGIDVRSLKLYRFVENEWEEVPAQVLDFGAHRLTTSNVIIPGYYELLVRESLCGNSITNDGENCGNCPADVQCQAGESCQEGICIQNPSTGPLSCFNVTTSRYLINSVEVTVPCPYGCINGVCQSPPSSCVSGNECWDANQRVFRRDSCILLPYSLPCPYGCSNNQCQPASGTTTCQQGNICLSENTRGTLRTDCLLAGEQQCPYGCENGFCLSPSGSDRCTPSPFCFSTTELGNINSECSISFHSIPCPFGCDNGACQPPPESVSCTGGSVCTSAYSRAVLRSDCSAYSWEFYYCPYGCTAGECQNPPDGTTCPSRLCLADNIAAEVSSSCSIPSTYREETEYCYNGCRDGQCI